MPRTILEGFNDFHTKLTPSSFESEAAAKHRASIKSCLEQNYEMTSFFRSGSFGNGTSIKGYSDVDYFAVIPTENLKSNSNNSLSNIKYSLATRFPNTGVRVSCPAIVVPFGTEAKETTEVVIADYVRQSNGFNVYDIPDCNEGWMNSSPKAHNDYVRRENERLSKKLKPLIRFVKAWKYYKNVNISSFYLELRITKLMSSESSIVYSIDLKNIFSWLYDKSIPAIQDPCGVSGNIYPCKTVAQKEDALSKLLTAKTRAIKAKEKEDAEDIKNAFYYWNLLFDEKFPSYYK